MRSLRLLLTILLSLLIVVGCVGGGGKLTTPPPLEGSTRIVIAPFFADPKAGNLGKWVPINLGTSLSLAIKQAEWIYDQSDAVNPVAAKLNELGLTMADIFEDAALAAKVGKALNADLIVVGQLKAPKIQRKDYDQPVKRQGKQAGISGSATYIRVRQSATIQAPLKVIDVKSGQVIFDASITDYIKYWFAFQTQQKGQVTFKSETEILADLGKHLTGRIAHALYPTGMPDVMLGEVLRRPDEELLGSSGVVQFD